MENKNSFNMQQKFFFENQNYLQHSYNPFIPNNVNNNINQIQNPQNIINNSETNNNIQNNNNYNENNLNNNTDKIVNAFNSNYNSNSSGDNNNSNNKIKIDLSNKFVLKKIKSIFDYFIKVEKNYNNMLESNSKNNYLKYSPCIIIQKSFVNDLKNYFNYDYYKSNKNIDINKIFEQYNNDPIICINDIKVLSIDDFKNNNIYLLDENSFYSLYPIVPNIEKDLNHKKEYDIYLKDNRGIIIIDNEDSKYLFIFEVNNHDINQIKNYDLINFNDNIRFFNETKGYLKNKNITEDIWNEIIIGFSNNCDFVVNKNNNIDININLINFKISSFHIYLQNNINQNYDESFLEKLKGYEKSLNKYEELLNKKEKIIKNNHNMNNVINLRKSNYNSDYSNNLAFSTVIINNNINNKNIINNNNINNNLINNNNIINNNNSNNNNLNDNNIINNSPIVNGEVRINRNKPSLGLGNIGSTCYMNATLQCLAHIPELSEELIRIYFMNKNNDFNNYMKTNRLTVEFTVLLIKIFFPNDNKTYFLPYNMKQIIGNQNSLFNGFEAEDAKDLLLFLIETMNTELNGGVSPIYNDIIRFGINQKDKKKIKETFLNDFYSKNFSPISRIFYGFSETCTSCSNCKTKRYNYECFNFLIFPLLDIKYYFFKNNNFYNTLNLDNCFSYYQKKEYYTGENKLYCNDCRCLQDSCVKRVIDKTPTILIIILDRGKNNQDFQDGFNIDEYLDLKNFVPNDTNTNYYLCGVITHQGESGPSGHFIAFCKMDFEAPWYSYNDASVNECKDIKEIFTNKIPYILFYRVIK